MAMKNDETSGRRRFLKNMIVGGGGAAALAAGGFGGLSQLAHGADGAVDDKFYVFAYFGGGWDVLLGLDPRRPDIFTDEDAGATRINTGYAQQAAAQFQEAPRESNGILLGPAARPLEAVSDRLAIVRGLSMDTLTHEVGRRRFITGKPPSGLQARGSAGSAWLASQFSGSRLIPNLSVRVESFNPDLPSEVSAVRVSGNDDLVAMLRRSTPELDPAIDQAIADLQRDEASCARAQSSPLMRASESARQRMRAVLDADIQALFDFDEDPAGIEDAELRAKMELLHSHFDLSGGAAAQERAALAGQALASGVSRVVTFQAAGGLDTHFDDWEDEQAQRQFDGFDSIARLAQFLESVPCGTGGESMLDRTIIVGFSEFMRTSLLNARGGRDHWLTNSALVLGGGVRPGVIGASSDVGMAPQTVDFATGEALPGIAEDDDRGLSVIRPEHILRTLLVDAGLEEDRADLRVPPIPTLLRG